jgi:hypothetical protein
LTYSILSRGGVEDQDGFKDLTWSAIGHPPYFAQFFEEIRTGVSTSGSIGQNQVGTASVCPTNGVVNNGPRIRTFRTTHDVGASPLGPHRQLIGGGGAKGVARGEDHGASTRHLGRGHLANCRRLANAIHTNEKPDGDATIIGRTVQRPIAGFEQSDQLRTKGRH